MSYRILIVFLITVTSVFSQEDIEVAEPDYIKSVLIKSSTPNNYFPLVKLGQSIHLSFDDLEGDFKQYYYKIQHCTYDWQLTNIASSVYSDGFVDDMIRNMDNSFNTYLNYTHYSISVPNNNIRFKITGNYLISVLDEDENVVFTRRFVVYKPKTEVGVSAHKARTIEGITTDQNVEITVNHPNMNINNPRQEIKLVIYQNGDWNTAITDILPQFYRGSQLIYKYGEETTFNAGNEYLFFDSKDYRNATNNIREVYLKDIYETILYVDKQRSLEPYTFYPDINGNFVIRTINEPDENLESEYTKVHFSLALEEQLKDKDIYVYGAFNNFKFTNENLLKFNEESNLYQTQIKFKQGFYNYKYVTVDQDDVLDLNEISGSYFQTENEYNVLVYYRRLGSRYDEVIGYGSGSSVNLQN